LDVLNSSRQIGRSTRIFTSAADDLDKCLNNK
jgi:hypothetical protein